MSKRLFASIGSVVALAAAVFTSPVPAQAALAGEDPVPAASARAIADGVHLNDIQVVGSHNSYHEVPTQAETELRRSFIGDADDFFQYRHAPLPVQFESQKVRQIELDVFLDPAGGKYANPLLRQVAGLGPYDPAMDEPGIKVLHVQDVDYNSNCLTLKNCLSEVKSWSDANPSHVPIAILLEFQDDEVPPVGDLPFVLPDRFDTPAAMDSVDAEIRSIMDPDDLLTPDDVRGSRATLDEAVTTDGWPTLGESRGKVMFMMDNAGAQRTAYLDGHPNLEGRVLFTKAEPGEPDAGFVSRNDPTSADIADLVRAGYMVRTRADVETVEARANDTTKRDAALASGAQWVSTDYPVRDYGVGFATDYFVEIPGGTVARCNPVDAPVGCVSADLEPVELPPDTTSTTTGISTSMSVPPPTAPGSTTSAPATPGSTAPAQGARPVALRPSFTG